MSKRKQILACSVPFLVIILLGLLPFLIALLGAALTQLFGEQVNEAEAPDIPIIGGLLGAMYVIGWLGLATIPLAVIALAGCTIVFVVKVFRILRQDPNDLTLKGRL